MQAFVGQLVFVSLPLSFTPSIHVYPRLSNIFTHSTYFLIPFLHTHSPIARVRHDTTSKLRSIINPSLQLHNNINKHITPLNWIWFLDQNHPGSYICTPPELVTSRLHAHHKISTINLLHGRPLHQHGLPKVSSHVPPSLPLIVHSTRSLI